MSLVLLIAGLLLWIAAHYFKRLLPEQRAALGEKGRGVVTVGVLLGLVLIIIGYRGAEFIPVWSPPAFLTHVNNALMLLALWIFGSSAAKGAKAWPAYKNRHPQLTAVKVWATAHLLVNGDLASIILFGGIFAWAIGSVILINKADPDWTPPERAGAKTVIRLAVITLVLYVLIGLVHGWLGVWPFPA